MEPLEWSAIQDITKQKKKSCDLNYETVCPNQRLNNNYGSHLNERQLPKIVYVNPVFHLMTVPLMKLYNPQTY
jgi:hypothetical protein